MAVAEERMSETGLIHGVTSYGSGWRKDVGNICLGSSRGTNLDESMDEAATESVHPSACIPKC